MSRPRRLSGYGFRSRAVGPPEGGRQLGHSKLRVFFEEGKPVRLEGQFHNLPPGAPIYGAVKYYKKGMNKSEKKREPGF